jgi:type I restriction enzyme R subunit
MTPEQKSRQEIDRQLEQCGWVVHNFRDMNISAGLGVAVREFPLKSGHADYLLYADGKALGVIEAKPEGHNLTGVETQSGKYLDGLPGGHWWCGRTRFAWVSSTTCSHRTKERSMNCLAVVMQLPTAPQGPVSKVVITPGLSHR